jgi:hypothetical protein
MDRERKIAGSDRLEHKGTRARRQRGVHELLIFQSTQEDDFGRQIHLLDAPGCLDTVVLRHCDIHHNYIRSEPNGRRDGLRTIMCAPDDLKFLGEKI